MYTTLSIFYPFYRPRTKEIFHTDLVDDLWKLVFDQLKVEELVPISKVCKRFQKLSLPLIAKKFNPYFHTAKLVGAQNISEAAHFFTTFQIHVVSLSTYENEVHDRNLIPFLFDNRSLTELALNSVHITDSSLLALPPSIKRLILISPAKITNYSLAQLPEGLEELHLCAATINQHFLKYLPHNLKILSVKFCPNLTFSVLKEFQKSRPYLKVKISDEITAHDIRAHFVSINTFSIQLFELKGKESSQIEKERLTEKLAQFYQQPVHRFFTNYQLYWKVNSLFPKEIYLSFLKYTTL